MLNKEFRLNSLHKNALKQSNKQNVIVITQLGLQKLGDFNDEDEGKDEIQVDTVCSRLLKNKLQNSLSVHRVMKPHAQVLKNKRYLSHTFHVKDNFSIKTIKKYQKWKYQHQSQISQIKKEMNKIMKQKYSEYQWQQTVGQYRKKISDIFNKWDALKTAEKNRENQRLNYIYKEKYKPTKKQKLVTIQSCPRPFQNKRISTINYAKSKQAPEILKKKTKIYHKLVNPLIKHNLQ